MRFGKGDDWIHKQLQPRNGLNTLETEAQFRIVVPEKGHEKAIFVFMAVTVLFLVSHEL